MFHVPRCEPEWISPPLMFQELVLRPVEVWSPWRLLQSLHVVAAEGGVGGRMHQGGGE